MHDIYVYIYIYIYIYIYTYIYIYIYILTIFNIPQALFIIPTYKKHQHKNYTTKTVHTVYTATKLTASMYCNYNS
jgi:hypothetical protein